LGGVKWITRKIALFLVKIGRSGPLRMQKSRYRLVLSLENGHDAESFFLCNDAATLWSIQRQVFLPNRNGLTSGSQPRTQGAP